MCGADATADCTNSSRGPTYSSAFYGCTCASDTDCTKTGYTKCSQVFGTESSITWCDKPCTADTDCKSRIWQGVYSCDTTASKCVGCKASTDCAAELFQKACNTAKTTCVECMTSTDCTTASYGKTCDTANGNLCTCANDTDCTGNLNGTACDSYDSVCTCSDQASGTRSDTLCVSGRKCTGAYPLDSQYTFSCK